MTYKEIIRPSKESVTKLLSIPVGWTRTNTRQNQLKTIRVVKTPIEIHRFLKHFGFTCNVL